MKHTWLKLLTSLLWSKKFRSLPDNDHRIVYIGLLILAKLGLEGESETFIATTLFVSVRKYKRILKTFSEVGLLDSTGVIIGFEDSQLTPEAIRKRRQRKRDKDRDMSRDESRDDVGKCHVTSHGDSRKQRVDIEEEEGGEKGPPQAIAQKKSQESRPGPQVLANDTQIQMLEEMAMERDSTIAEVAAEIGIPYPIRARDVTVMRRRLEKTRRRSPEKDQQDARNTILRMLKTDLERVYGFEGYGAARRWIDADDIDEAYRKSLLTHLTTIKSDPDFNAQQEVAH